MKVVAIIILNLYVATNFIFGQTNIKLSVVLDSLVKEDQKWRDLSRRINNSEIDSIELITVQNNIKLTDSLNFIVVKKIFTQYGYPGYNIVGEKSSHNFWLIVQHSDNHPDFQDSVLTEMKAEIDKGNSSSIDYAYLMDRVKINKKQLQVYGTQMSINEYGTSYEPKPLVDPEKVNERRKSVGLPAIEEYIKVMNERYFGTLKKK